MDFNSKPILFFMLSVFFLNLTGCNLFESNQVSNREITDASSWSEKDQYPRFSSCEGLESEEERNCFESVISMSIYNYIADQGWVVSQNIDAEVVLNLVVDQEGFISIKSLDASENVLEMIPNLETTLHEAVSMIPQAQAGVKTNVGILVATSFTLTIRIFAQEEN